MPRQRRDTLRPSLPSLTYFIRRTLLSFIRGDSQSPSHQFRLLEWGSGATKGYVVTLSPESGCILGPLGYCSAHGGAATQGARTLPRHPLSPVRAIPRIINFWENMYAKSMGPVEMSVAAIRGP